jgi:carboxyl-terminal processing protease
MAMKKRFLLGAIGGLVATLALSVWVIEGALTVGASSSPALIKQDYLEAVNIVRTHYAGSVDMVSVTTKAIRGMLAVLDPHSNYLTPREYSNLRQEQESEFYGIGVTINQRNGRVYILSVVPGTPAARAGLRYGDAILAVDGESATDWTTQEVVRRVRGEKGTTVELTIERVGERAPLVVRLQRGLVPLPSIRTAFMIRPEVGYIGLTGGFQSTTADELDEHLRRLKAQGMTSLILDLRNNPGGFLDQAVSVASRFLRPGEAIVSIRGRTRERTFRAEADHTEEMPLVVLINRNSASASEIVAGALQDHDRALIVGETSFGKGLVQTVIPILRGSGGAVTLSTARYYTPSGRLIQRDYTAVSAYQYYAGRGNGKQGPAAKTDGGRRVYGGGGIDPDVAVPTPNDPLRSRLSGAVFEFARHLLAGQIAGFADFRVERAVPLVREDELLLPVGDRLLQALIDFVTARPDFDLTEKTLRAHLDYIRGKLQEEIATARYGIDTSTRLTLLHDEQMLRAIEALPQAKQLVETVRQGKRTRS